jgi:ribosome-binding protein aMBF1 (putative translation factor)
VTERELTTQELRLVVVVLNQLPDLVKLARRRRGLTQVRLAEKLGVNWRTIQRLECRAHDPSHDTVKILLNWLVNDGLT